jgi:hypothetical protein
MADVSVEFGAKDVGLEKTLKTIQDQMVSLQGEVDSGTLSFQEISQKMREIKTAEGIFAKLGGEVSEAAKSFKELEDQTRRAEAVTKSNRTAIEVYSDTVDELQKLLDAGAISQKTYASAIDKAEAALKAATPQTEEAKRANEELEASLKKAEQETRALAEEQKKAEAVTKANRSATEIYNQEVEELQKHLSEGRISMETFEKAVGKADAKLAAASPQVEEIGKDIQDAGNKSEKMGEQSGMGFAKFVAGVGLGQIAAKAFTAVLDSAFAAVRGTIQGFTDALDLGGRLSDLSASTGETAGKLLVLERAFDNSGIGAEKVGSSIAKMQKNIEDARDGSGTAANAFAAMGVSVDELEGKLPTEQFKILSSGIQSIDDPTQRAAAAMGVFGKSGAELLPLLTNLDGELGEARDTVGSMAEIMDRRNATFDAVGDRFKTIGEKVRDFAAGILDKALPAIDAITSALSRIDAAKIGQNLADAFLGGEKAMSGFQAAVDAISVGELGLAFKAFFESAKLQVMQTGNSIINIFSAAFDTVAEIIANVFRSDGPTLMVIKSAFDFVAGYVKEKVAGSLADTFAGMGPMFSGMAESLKQSAEAGATSAELALQRIPIAAELAAEDIGTNLAGSVDRFKENLAEANTEFFNTSEQAQKVADIEAEIATRVGATNAERANTTEQLEKEKEARAEIAAKAAEDAEKEKANAVALVELETAINTAKASGNEELVKSLEAQKQKLDNEKEIAKLTAEYLPLVGNNAKEAERLATNMVNAKNAAAGIGNTNAVVTITTTVDDTRWKDLLAELSANSNPKAIAVALEVTGKDNLNEAFLTLQNMEQINKNYQAAFTAIGASSIEEVLANLQGIPTESQRQLAMQITGEEDFDRAVRKLDSVGLTKETKLLLQSQGFESMDAFQNQLDGIVGDKRTKLILETLNVKDAETAKDALAAILNNDGKKATVTADADITPAEQKIAELSTKTAKVPLDADTSPLQSSLSAFTATAQKLTLDASDAIKTIRSELEKPIKLDLSGATSSGGPGDNSPGGPGDNSPSGLTGLVNDIKTLLTTLSQKLPTPALA